MNGWLTTYHKQLVFGALDGSVTTFAVIAAAAGANLPAAIVLALGCANLLADGFSMAASQYLSARSKTTESTEGTGEVSAVNSSVAVLVAFVLIGAIPLIGYAAELLVSLDSERTSLFAISSFLAGAVFMAVGITKGQSNSGNPLASALETLVLGGVAAAIAYGVGHGLAGLLG